MFNSDAVIKQSFWLMVFSLAIVLTGCAGITPTQVPPEDAHYSNGGEYKDSDRSEEYSAIARGEDRYSAIGPGESNHMNRSPETDLGASNEIASTLQCIPSPLGPICSAYPVVITSESHGSAAGRIKLSPTSSAGRSASPFWNIWVDQGGRIEQALVLKKSHDLILDLSRYRYNSRLSTSISPEVIKTIEESCDRDWLRFKVRPFSLDQKLSLTKYEDTLEVKLDHLCGSPNPKDLKLIEEYRNKRLDLPRLAKAVQGGQIKFSFVPQEPGCAVMGLSIWDETGMVPLDHLVVTLPIAKPNEPPPPCGITGDPRITLTQDTDSLLRIALDRNADNPPPVASLSMFEAEVGGDLRTVAILIERNLYENTKGRKGLHTWVTEGLLSDYLANQLLDQLNVARENLDSESPNRHPYPYAPMARELEIKLFSQYQGLENAAKYARDALVRAVNTAKEEFPLVLIRAVNAKNHRFIVPLGLLAAKIETPVFKKSMTVITPLPVERYPATRACINTWTLAVPESLENDNSSPERLVEANNIVDFERIKTEAQLEKYVSSEGNESSPDALPTKAEGLILLAHHAPSVIWFQDESKRVSSEQLERRFPTGSVALLAGCSTASPEGDYQKWISKLNEHGIDAMIVSPFPVLTEYATHFALNFGLAAQSARRNNKTPTILELFQEASNATLKKFKAQYGENTAFNEMALEFVVAGDSSLRMCANR
jgi:hypothetical protein